MLKKVIVLTLLAVSSLQFLAQSQSFYVIRRERSLLLNFGTGTSTYLGELNNPKDFMDAKPNINAGFQYFISNRISTRAEITWFQLSGSDKEADDRERKDRNLSFISNNYEITLTGTVHLFPLGNRFYQRPKINFYAFAGIGMLYFNPKAELNGKKYALQPLQTEGVPYSRFQPVIPFGIGGKLKISPFFNLAIEGGMRKTFTDYLDDVSTKHPDKTGWEPTRAALSDRRPETGLQPYVAGAQRGNPSKKDAYFLVNVKLEYYLPFNFALGSPSKRLYNKKRRSHRSKSR